jgi:hypothetical protein
MLNIILEIPAQVAGSVRYFSGMTNVITKKRIKLEKSFAGSLITCYMKEKSL